jgi:peptide-methionine (S)-S-oxide reductase
MENTNQAIATFAGGCFWGIEDTFHKTKGVNEAFSGYSGGHVENPSYEQVSRGNTGHAESVQVTYDHSQVSYEELLKVFWDHIDPTTKDRQGPDHGSQYRSIIFYHTPEQQAAAEKSKEELAKSGKYDKPIVTEILPAEPFYKAEEYHQRYFEKHNLNACPA